MTLERGDDHGFGWTTPGFPDGRVRTTGRESGTQAGEEKGERRASGRSSSTGANEGAVERGRPPSRPSDRSPLPVSSPAASVARAASGPKVKVLDELRRQLRLRHRSKATERSYVGWVKRFILFHGKRHPREMGKVEVEEFLTHLAVELDVAASTQNQALNAILFFYRMVIMREVGDISRMVRARRPVRVPVVMTPAEAEAVLVHLKGDSLAISILLWGGGLRLREALRLRVQDIDFERREIRVRDGKGRRDRLTVLPDRATEYLQLRIRKSLVLHRQDLDEGLGEVELPDALARKYPNAGREPRWQWIFAANSTSACKRTGRMGRHHVFDSTVQRHVKRAAIKAGVTKRVSPHTFRHSFATALLDNGYDIRTVQELLGHRSLNTTMIYTHVLNRGGRGVLSPADLRPR